MEEAHPTPHDIGAEAGPECMAALRAAEVGTHDVPLTVMSLKTVA